MRNGPGDFVALPSRKRDSSCETRAERYFAREYSCIREVGSKEGQKTSESLAAPLRTSVNEERHPNNYLFYNNLIYREAQPIWPLTCPAIRGRIVALPQGVGDFCVVDGQNRSTSLEVPIRQTSPGQPASRPLRRTRRPVFPATNRETSEVPCRILMAQRTRFGGLALRAGVRCPLYTPTSPISCHSPPPGVPSLCPIHTRPWTAGGFWLPSDPRRRVLKICPPHNWQLSQRRV